MKRERKHNDGERMKKTYIRNWIICIASLGLAIFCYFYL